MIRKSGSVAAINFFPRLIHTEDHLHLGNRFHVHEKNPDIFWLIFHISKKKYTTTKIMNRSEKCFRKTNISASHTSAVYG